MQRMADIDFLKVRFTATVVLQFEKDFIGSWQVLLSQRPHVSLVMNVSIVPGWYLLS